MMLLKFLGKGGSGDGECPSLYATDTGRGTFLVSGRPITDRATVVRLDMEPHETAVEVPKAERTFYGVTAAA